MFRREKISRRDGAHYESYNVVGNAASVDIVNDRNVNETHLPV